MEPDGTVRALAAGACDVTVQTVNGWEDSVRVTVME